MPCGFDIPRTLEEMPLLSAHEGWADVKAPGKYLIEVRDGHNNARSPRPYALTAALAPTADPAEPNDKLGTATPLPLGEALRASILPKADVDYYRVTLPRPGGSYA